LRLDPHSEVGHENLAAIMAALLLRLAAVTLVGGIVVAGLVVFSAPYWTRVLLGLVFIGTAFLVAWLTLRHVPAASRRLIAPRLLRRHRVVAPILLGLTAAALIAVAFMPSNIALHAAGVVAGVLFLIIRIGLLALPFFIVRWLWRLLFRLGRRLSGSETVTTAENRE
jgi:hypothetical protein